MRRSIVIVLAAGMSWGAVSGAGASPDGGIAQPEDLAKSVLRSACDVQWVDGVCDSVAYTDPGYRTVGDPSLGRPLQLRIGATHEHSGYSDGDPDTRPADYFRAGRIGHNVADTEGDTGVALDFMWSSEHSENEKLPVTTAEACVTPPPSAGTSVLDLERVVPPLDCQNVLLADHYRKWEATLEQAVDATDRRNGVHTGFTAVRGFEFTNDYYNHLGIYFSRNVVNAKIDGSYLSTDQLWSWLRRSPLKGGGSDALVVFNHPGGNPALSPFDGELPTGDVLQAVLGGANWHDLAYVPSVDRQVSGIAVNGGDDLQWYVKALTRGWHLGPIADEDEHQREWATSDDGKTVVLTGGRSPRDYYFALQHNRTMAYSKDVVDGAPGTDAQYPSVRFWADAPSPDASGAAQMGAQLRGGAHSLELAASGLAPGSTAVIVSRGSATPAALGTAGADGTIRATRAVTAPGTGEDWWFVVICGPDSTRCGQDELHDVVTSPIWLRAG